MPKNGRIILKDFNLGGIADSKYHGIKNSLASIVGFNIHGEPGILKVAQKLTKESGATVDENVQKIVPCSDGKSYLFSSGTGKIWERTNGGTYTLVHTDANGAILGADEHEGYLYWFTQNKIGRWQIGTAWGGASDNWNTFSNGNASFHPSIIKNGILYIGDKNYVAQIDGGVFTGNALDIESKYRIKSLGETSTGILIGTYVNNNVNKTKIFAWDTWSLSFTSEDAIPEVGINSFLALDNAIVVNAGTKGNLYAYNGQTLNQFKRIPGSWDGSNEALIHPYAAANFLGMPLFGLSNSSGNPALQGVYSFGSYSSNYPRVLNLEYVISQDKTSNIEVTAIAVVGTDILVAWKDGTTYGVDKVDWNNKYGSAYLETRIIEVERTLGKDFSVNVHYRDLPNDTNIRLYSNKNFAGYSEISLTDDANRKLKYGAVKLAGVQALQLKLAAVVSGNNAPEIESIEITY